jgi:hypothetical protein
MHADCRAEFTPPAPLNWTASRCMCHQIRVGDVNCIPDDTNLAHDCMLLTENSDTGHDSCYRLSKTRLTRPTRINRRFRRVGRVNLASDNQLTENGDVETFQFCFYFAVNIRFVGEVDGHAFRFNSRRRGACRKRTNQDLDES